MANSTCKAPNCERESISYSPFCGQHTRNSELKKAINKRKKEDMTSVYWDEVELKGIVFEHIHFAAGTFSNIEFQNVQFIHCGFSDCDFEHAVLINTIFSNCELEKCSFSDVTFQESSFQGCKIIDGSFSEINMADESFFKDCDLDSCEFSGGLFSETGVTSGCRFYSNAFTQFSISRSAFEHCQFIESTFSKSTFYDSSFINCVFNTITHDFKLTGPPILCDFNGTEFINTAMPRDFRVWNNFRLQPADFYLKTVNRLLQDNHPNHLKELGMALLHLEQFEGIDEISIRLAVAALFKRLAADAAHAGNYGIIGEILSAYGSIPEKYRGHTGFFLPPADDTNGLEPGRVRLSIRVDLDQWKVSRVSEFLSLMAEMETVLPEGLAQEIDFIERGSLIIEILGSLKPLLAYFQAILDFGKSSYELKLKGYELESKKIDLEYHRDLKQIELKKANLELEKAQLDVYHQKLELMAKIKEQTGYDHLAFSKSKKGKRAEEIAENMKKEFPVLHLRLEE